MKRTPLRRSTPLRARSKKRERLYATERRRLVSELLASRPVCERCRRNRSDDVHEVKSRARGGSITDLSNLACLCRPCHTWVTTNPDAAHAEGWLLHSWE